MTELIAEADRQPDFFEDNDTLERHKQIDNVVDQLNRKLGKNAIRYGSMGTKPSWSMRQENRSWGFTSRWTELPVAKTE